MNQNPCLRGLLVLDRNGLIAAILAYSAWGFFPLYWQLLKHVSALETMSHRVIWSLLFYGAIAYFRGTLSQFRSFFVRTSDLREKPNENRGRLLRLSLGSCFIAINWLLYVWAVTHGHVMETSLGYFINPLINVAIGALIFKERLAPLQKLSLLFAGAGVLWLTLDYGRPPWIALGLATTFAIYGYVKKTVKGDATVVSMAETTVLLPIALAAAFWIRANSGGTENFEILHSTTASWAQLTASPASLSGFEWFLLIGGGAVTGLPLLLFGVAAQRLPFSVLGFFQYLAPTIQFLSAVFFFNEPLGDSRLAGFALIWIALGIFIVHLQRAARANTRNSR
ncbi:MAG: EamA family transporter RarD [Bdellovibrionales bacterium]|jgi:chloramphenicol-sensitive protein RarD|nr:EamA family transporter RarD [Bdellovibrionales bacterium]